MIEKKKGGKGGKGCGIAFLLALFLAVPAFAQDNIDVGHIVGGGKYLGGRTVDNQTIVPMIGIDKNGNTSISALSGEGVDIVNLNTTLDTVAGAGTTVSDAAALSGSLYVHRLTGANGTVGWKFVTATPIGSVQFLLGTTAGVIKIYGESGSTCNGGSVDAACTLTTGILPHICIKTAALTYICA